MEKPTYEEIRDAAKKSKRAAIDISIKKYLYLLTLTKKQIQVLPFTFLKADGCALCYRYMNSGYECPLGQYRCSTFNCDCIEEWRDMYDAYTKMKEHPDWGSFHHRFIFNATKIYICLLKLKGTIK